MTQADRTLRLYRAAMARDLRPIPSLWRRLLAVLRRAR